MSNRLAAIMLAGALAALVAACARGPEVTPLMQAQTGGAATVNDHTRKAFSRPAANLENASRADFIIGNAFFNSPWIVAPASAGARDGLGALFNARSCDACHNNDGRGRPPESGQPPVSLVFQLSVPGTGPHGDPLPEPNYGGNLNPFAIDGLSAEGTVRIEHEEVAGAFADGEAYILLKPRYLFEQLAYGDLAPETQVSPRVAPSVIGSGLLEFVPEAQILEWEDPDDRNGDGISGRANRVWSLSSESVVLGRYGWKANQPDIAHQTAAAFNGEIGMTTALRPTENCMPSQSVCSATPNGGSPEISDEIFARIVRYQRTLGVPSRRHLDRPEVRTGARLFLESGCAACHRPTLNTLEVPEVPELAHQTFHPFTDMLLHDMGSDLADDRPDFGASGSEWRTAPLWGLGLQRTVNDHTFLLHDGRARNVTEAILWHGGEGGQAREAFRRLSRVDREALLAFLDSL